MVVIPKLQAPRIIHGAGWPALSSHAKAAMPTLQQYCSITLKHKVHAGLRASGGSGGSTASESVLRPSKWKRFGMSGSGGASTPTPSSPVAGPLSSQSAADAAYLRTPLSLQMVSACLPSPAVQLARQSVMMHNLCCMASDDARHCLHHSTDMLKAFAWS